MVKLEKKGKLTNELKTKYQTKFLELEGLYEEAVKNVEANGKAKQVNRANKFQNSMDYMTSVAPVDDIALRNIERNKGRETITNEEVLKDPNYQENTENVETKKENNFERFSEALSKDDNSITKEEKPSLKAEMLSNLKDTSFTKVVGNQNININANNYKSIYMKIYIRMKLKV